MAVNTRPRHRWRGFGLFGLPIDLIIVREFPLPKQSNWQAPLGTRCLAAAVPDPLAQKLIPRPYSGAEVGRDD